VKSSLFRPAEKRSKPGVVFPKQGQKQTDLPLSILHPSESSTFRREKELDDREVSVRGSEMQRRKLSVVREGRVGEREGR
jgi:hypothetical protein